MGNGVDKFLEAPGKAIETAHTLYEDAAQESVKEVGKFIARPLKAINAAFSGVDCWIEKRNYAIEETKAILAEKLKHIDASKIVPPEPYVAIPALEGISCSMDNKELRELYANLLAKSINVDRKDLVHPCLVEIIKQLSPLDAQIIKQLKLNSNNCILTFEYGLRTSLGNETLYLSESYIPIIKHCMLLPGMNVSSKAIQISIDNLIRLGLVTVEYGKSINGDNEYENIKEKFIDEAKSIILAYNNKDEYKDYNIETVRGVVESTTLFNLFCDICVD